MNRDEEFSDEEFELIKQHAIDMEHPGKDCPCDECLERFPWNPMS